MRRIAIFNKKGGVGKTFISVHLSAAFAQMGYRTLVCDCDSQGDLSSVYLSDHEQLSHSMADIFAGTGIPTEDLIQPTTVDGLSIIPADDRLDNYDKISGYKTDPQALVLADALSEVQDNFDLILFDCPPRSHLTSFAALIAASEVLVPIDPIKFSLRSIVRLNREIQNAQENLNPDLRIRGYFLSRIKNRSTADHTFRDLIIEKLPTNLMLKTQIPDMDTFKTAINLDTPVTLHAPRSKPAAVIRQFAKEVLTEDTNNDDQQATTA